MLYVRYIPTGISGGGSGGSVTSVGLADGSSTPIYNISGSPVTTSGTLTFSLATQTANRIFAGPTTGSAAQPGFRGLVSADIASLFGNLTDAGTDGITVTGGTGAVLGSGTSLSQHVADTTHNGYLSSTDWNTFNGKQPAGSYITSLTGDVTASGPGAAAASLVATSNATLTTLSALTSAASLATVGTITTGTWNATTIAIAHGGTGQTSASAAFNALSPMTALGDTIYGGASGAGTRLAGNTTATKQFLSQTGNGSVSAAPVWAAISAGDLPTITLTGDVTGAASGGSIATTAAATQNNITSIPNLATVGTITTGTWNGTTIAVNHGGTGDTSFTAYSVLCGGTTSTGALQNVSGVGTSGQVLTSNGASALPTWQSGGGGTVTSVTFTGDGTVLSSTPSSAVTTSGTLTATLNNHNAGTYLGGPYSGAAAAPTFKAFQAPTVQKFTATGSQTGWLFTISTTSTVAVGDTYTNNSNTYTVQGALTAQSGQVLFMSGTGATSGTTLTRNTGSGTSSITFSTKVATATYTTATGALYLRVRAAGAGGGGAGSGSSGDGNGNTGTLTTFGANLVTCQPGVGGSSAATSGSGGPGGTATLGSGPLGVAFAGGGGGSSMVTSSTAYAAPGIGGSNAFGGGAAGTNITGGSAGINGATNTGAGGSGGGFGAATGHAGGGGGAGGFADALFTSSLLSTYPYIIGTGGTGGTAGTGASAGGNGADGIIIVEEYYQ